MKTLNRMVACLLLLSGTALATPQELETSELASFSMEQLLELRVVSVNTDLRKLTGSAAALQIIDGERIRRSGYRTLPEILRMAVGVHVARIDKTDWAISSRGFNSNFADKMEVLLDGRRLQTPLFLGVQWGLQDTFIEDIERIEIIRGPGGALWGINAVNGVINIVTRSSKDSLGHLGYIGGGNEEKAFAGYRYGARIKDNWHYRVWANTWERDYDTSEDGRRSADSPNRVATGFRMDWGNDQDGLFNLQGDTWYRQANDRDVNFAPGQLGGRQSPVVDTFRGSNLIARWSRIFPGQSELTLSAYWDQLIRDAALLGDERDSFDISINQRIPLGSRHEVRWGLDYLISKDTVANSFSVTVKPEKESLSVFEFFLQDQFDVVPDRLSAIIGTKLEHNDNTGFEWHPSLRLIWTPTPQQSLWASATRALRTPSRLDTGVRFIVDQIDPQTFVAIVGQDDFEAEELTAWELGYRLGIGREWALDINAFVHDYDNLRSFENPQGPDDFFIEDNAAFVPLRAENNSSGRSQGAELSLTWQAGPSLNTRLGYAYFDLDTTLGPNSIASDLNATSGKDPRHNGFIQASWEPRHNIEVDAMLRYVSRLNGVNLRVDGYTDFDLRLGWQFHSHWSLALVGKNLLQKGVVQTESDISFGERNLVERSVFLQLNFQR